MNSIVRYTAMNILAALSICCSDSEQPKPTNGSPENLLTWYSKKHFGSDANVDVAKFPNFNPIDYYLTVDVYRDVLTAEILRTTFFYEISSAMKSIAEDEQLKQFEGKHRFKLRIETTNRKGFTDTSNVIDVILPSNLDVNWQYMNSNVSSFLKYLNREGKTNPRVNVAWRIRAIKPEYWK